MGFIHMLAVNRQLNGVVDGIHSKFHRLEDLINGYRSVNGSNFNEVNTLISSISRDIVEMEYKVNALDYAETVSLLLLWTNGRKYPWMQWQAFANMSLNEAKLYVNEYKPGYYK